MHDDVVKSHLHQKLRAAREALVWKLDGLSDYDIRRPMTPTGTNLLGLVKHNAISDSRYFGDVFDRPFPEPLPQWDDPAAFGADHWATEQETRDEVVGLYRRVWAHSDATIEALGLDDRGYVPWWNETVPLFNVMAARLVDAVRHAGHADILRELLDGAVGVDPNSLPLHGRDSAYWEARNAVIENAALPRKRVGAGALITDEAGRVLIVEPAYKPTWEVPGGVVEQDETAFDACRRECLEELGLELDIGPVLVIDHQCDGGDRGDSIMFIYDGGVIDADTEIKIPTEELMSFRFVDPSALDELLVPRLARRMHFALHARLTSRVVELVDGMPTQP